LYPECPTGDFFGVAPTHKRVTLTGTIIDRGVVEAWENLDALGLMQQTVPWWSAFIRVHPRR